VRVSNASACAAAAISLVFVFPSLTFAIFSLLQIFFLTLLLLPPFLVLPRRK
jgi:hypothetical protein